MPYIDRDAFSKQLEHEKELMERGLSFNTSLIAHTIGIVQEKVKKFPTADVEPIVHAHWIRRLRDHRNDYHDVMEYPYRCSACRVKNKELTKRCLECGARMDEKVR